ncbi:MAG TPA: hypothetical protein VH352_02530 [Pseudonocardiaceae bacterium]|jgi:hypothetical protein|nr:hypothetical protein [Pseudonocardiaceae bacterium]
MSHLLDDSLLDDPARLATADGESGGGLRAAAYAGAQVRATAEAVAATDIHDLRGTRPRALVLVSRPGVAPAVNRLLTALLGPGCPVPLVTAEEAPGWVGPLDVVLAHTDDPGDVPLAESVHRAGRFGARVLLTAPEDGPVAAAAAGTAALLPSRVRVPPGFAFPRALAAGLALLDTLGLLRTDLDVLADELDREAEKDNASYESFVNPAKALALRIADRTPVLCGLDRVAVAVADHAVDVLAGFAGVIAGAADHVQLDGRPALRRAAIRATSGGDIFADPDDNPAGLLRVLLLSILTDPHSDAAKLVTQDLLPGADLLAPAEETAGGPAVGAAVLALRFEMTAVYLGLATGALGGPGRYAPMAV